MTVHPDLIDEITNDPAGMGYAGKTPLEKKQLGEALTRPGPFPASEIAKTLAFVGRMDAAEKVGPLLATYSDVDYDDPTHLQAITNGLDWLWNDLGLIDQATKNVVLALNQNRRSRFEERGLRNVTVAKIIEAGG